MPAGSTADAKAAVTAATGVSSRPAAAAAAATGSRRGRPIFAPWAHYMSPPPSPSPLASTLPRPPPPTSARAFTTSLSLLAGGGAIIYGMQYRPSSFWVNSSDLSLPVAVIALV